MAKWSINRYDSKGLRVRYNPKSKEVVVEAWDDDNKDSAWLYIPLIEFQQLIKRSKIMKKL